MVFSTKHRISAVLLSVLWTTALFSSCAETPKEDFYEASYYTIFSEGFGLSEEEFFERFQAKDRDDWEVYEGETTISSLQTDELFSYTRYTVSEPVEIAGLSCTMTLRFFEEKGLTNISYSAIIEDLSDEELYEQIMSVYDSICETLGEPGWNGSYGDGIYWERYDSLQTFTEETDAWAEENPGQPFRSMSTIWGISDTAVKGDPYDEYATLAVQFNWPIEDTTPAVWEFGFSRTYYD